MALYAFDGTGNKDNPVDAKDTNVVKFFNAYKAGYNGPGDNFYVSGVGTRWGLLGKVVGSIFGAGGRTRLKRAKKALRRNVRKGDTTIDIVGFSRGAALALEFANEVETMTLGGVTSTPVRFLGLWDTVASFGIPGNDINLGHNLGLAANVERCFHALALDERRFTFPLTRIVQDKLTDQDLITVSDVWFRGFHSDVGGGNQNEALSSIPLVWMFQRAADAGIAIPAAHVDHHARLRNPNAPCQKARMDIKANRKRPIGIHDLVHESVTRRVKADRFAANNPPKGLRIMADNGRILRRRFK
jgi:uncharacterized protein (DUF2235 family)